MSPMEATVDSSSPGSRLDADHPENGVFIPCLFTLLSRGRVRARIGNGPRNALMRGSLCRRLRSMSMFLTTPNGSPRKKRLPAALAANLWKPGPRREGWHLLRDDAVGAPGRDDVLGKIVALQRDLEEEPQGRGTGIDSLYRRPDRRQRQLIAMDILCRWPCRQTGPGNRQTF